MNSRRGLLDAPLLRYGAAVGATVTALVCHRIFCWLSGNDLPSYTLFYTATMLAALTAGFGPGLLATAASALLADYWLLAPSGSFAIRFTHDAVGVALFSFNALLMISVVELYRRSRRKTAFFEAELAAQNEILKTEKSLRLSDARLHLAHDAAKAAAWESYSGDREDVWSEGMWKLIGLEPHSCKPSVTAMLRTIHPEDRQAFIWAAKACSRDGGDFNAEWRVAGTNPVRWLMSRGRPLDDGSGRSAGHFGVVMDITDIKLAEEAREGLISELKAALSQVRKLSGMLPICAACKKIRNDEGYWEQIEAYIRQHSEAEFSHGLCPDCAQKIYPPYIPPLKQRDTRVALSVAPAAKDV